MDKFWKQIIAAVIMGAMLPQLMLNVGSWIAPTATEPALMENTTDAEETVGTHQPQTIHLPVLVEENRILVMELEDYILGVVLAEMPASFEEEALKAQAVVARTYALRRLALGDRHSDVAICTDSTCCQAYISTEDYLQQRGSQSDVDKILKAVKQTEGLVLTYEGELIEATYFSCSGGRTEDAAAVWGTDIPYLQAVDSPGEENAQIYWSQMYFTAEEFSEALERNLDGTPDSWLGSCTFTEGGGVASMVIGGITYSGTELRKLLKLNSTAFTMTPDRSGILVETLGRGHRVGMSQYGAEAMAVLGSTCEEILAYYYQGTRIDKLENIG